jgi:hypothetical protein
LATIQEYDKRLTNDSTNILMKLNRAFLYFFTEGYERAIKEFKLLDATYPGDPGIENMRELFLSFDRKSYLDSICEN